jgi:hypothetical protein
MFIFFLASYLQVLFLLWKRQKPGNLLVMSRLKVRWYTRHKLKKHVIQDTNRIIIPHYHFTGLSFWVFGSRLLSLLSIHSASDVVLRKSTQVMNHKHKEKRRTRYRIELCMFIISIFSTLLSASYLEYCLLSCSMPCFIQVVLISSLAVVYHQPGLRPR